MGGRRLTDQEAIGLKFSKLTITHRHGVDGRNHTLWGCLCECGKVTTAEMASLTNGSKKSCGCLKHENSSCVKHGATRPGANPDLKRTFEIWTGIRKRCLNPRDRAYKWYGGRGIDVDKNWDTFDGFIRDMGIAPNGLTIERIDVDKGYSKENCKWAALIEQARNKTTTLWVAHNGIKWCLKELCKHLGIPYMRVYKRYRVRGWTLERAIQP